MEKIINSAFDFFAYALPGAFLILSFLLLDPQNETCEDFLRFAQRLQAGSGVLLLALGYVVGFAVTPVGRKMYRMFQRQALFNWLDKILEGGLKKQAYSFDVPENGQPLMSVSERFVLVREYSPNNFRHIESWHVYSLMSHNMALVHLLIAVFIGLRLAFFEPASAWIWVLCAVAAIKLALLFLYSAVKFNIWSTNELNATVKGLHLAERNRPTESHSQS